MFDDFLQRTASEVDRVSRDPWGTAPIVTRALVAEPQQIFGDKDLEGVLERFNVTPSGVTVVLEQKVVPPELCKTREDLERFRRRGATLMLPALQRRLDSVKLICDALHSATSVPCFGVGYVTPPNSQGFPAHWDLGSVSVVQVSGSKTWELRRPVITQDRELNIPWPVRGFRDGELDGEPYATVVLYPGDCLFIPRGWVHFARATNEESRHVSIGALHKGINLAACHTVYP